MRVEGEVSELEPEAFAGKDRKRRKHRPNVVFEWWFGALGCAEVVRDERGIFHAIGKDLEDC